MDQALLQDATGTLAWLEFEQMGKDGVAIRQATQYVDHNILQTGYENADDHRFWRSVCERYGAIFSGPGNGISHWAHMERFDIPGETMLGCDSHTPHAGACGMLAIGAGGFEVANAMAGEPYRLTMPEVVQVNLTGKFKPWGSAKDVILELLNRFDVKWAKNKVLEYAGPALKELTVPSRGTVANMGKDLGVVAHALDGKHVAPGIAMAVSPGSRQTLLLMLTSGLMTKLIKAGVRELEVACGPCIGMGFAPPTKGASVRTFNRNFEGRSGTADDLVYLCSPETAAATAVHGVITDPRELGKYPALKEPTKYPVDTSGFEWPPKDRSAVHVVRGPNIAPLPVAAPPKDTIEGEVLLRLGDNISTDHIMPAGAKILPLRSNIPAIADHVFEYVDPTFPERAKKAGGGFIVAGENYGQGSSREHAAVAPMFLGVHLVLAKGFARIHMDNLVNSGIPPVTFADPRGYEEIQQGDRLRITNLLAAIRGRGDAVLENLTRGTKTSVRVELRPYQREVLLAGGGIRSRVGVPAGSGRASAVPHLHRTDSVRGTHPLLAKAHRPRASDVDLGLEADRVDAKGHVLSERGATRGVLRPGRRGRRAFGVRRPEVSQGCLRRNSKRHDVPDRSNIAEGVVPPGRVDLPDHVRAALPEPGRPGDPDVARRRDGNRDAGLAAVPGRARGIPD